MSVRAEEVQSSVSKIRRSLLIGVNGYRPAIGQLNYCVSDAIKIEKALNSRRDGFTATESKLLTDEQSDELRPTRSNIIEQIVHLCKAAKGEDTIILHFSGHGIVGEDKSCYLLPLDASAASLEDTAIPWNKIRSWVEQSRAKYKVLMLDACHSGAGRDPVDSVHRSVRVVEELERSTEGFVCVTSCSGGQLSYELPEFGQGIFSHYLVEGILGAADPLGRGVIDIDSLFNYVRERTSEQARRLGVTQEPYLISKITVPLKTYTIAAATLGRSIDQVLVLTENPFLGSLLEAGIKIAPLARRAAWVKDIELAISNAEIQINYDAVYIDVGKNWNRKKDFINLIRKRYPIVPFVLVGSRDRFLDNLSMEERLRFKEYFFLDVATPISQAPDLITDTLKQVQWDIRAKYGEKQNL